MKNEKVTCGMRADNEVIRRAHCVQWAWTEKPPQGASDIDAFVSPN